MDELNFKSDNEAPAHPAILEALARANVGSATAYANDAMSLALNEAFGRYFDTDVSVLPLATGTAANSIILAELSPPWGAIFCHPNAHIQNDEGGAPEFYTHGAKLTLVDGPNGKLQPQALEQAITQAGVHGVHNAKPAVVSITQATECGTCYSPDEIQALADVAHEHDLPIHMDGARFANALMYLEVTPGDMTWRAGVDALAYGGTKNGALTAEAIVVFGHPDWLEGMERRRKRGGHLLSKMRYVSAQLLALLDDELSHRLAKTANERAQALAQGIEATGLATLKWPVQANEVFIQAERALLDRLKAAGAQFHIWPNYEDVARLVCRFDTTTDQITQFIELMKKEA